MTNIQNKVFQNLFQNFFLDRHISMTSTITRTHIATYLTLREFETATIPPEMTYTRL